MRRPHSLRLRFMGAWLLAASPAALACAPQQSSLRSLIDSANARVRRAPPDRESREATMALLGAPLTPEAATRVAILNNWRVRAAYEKLGVAHGELVHAVRMPNPQVEAALRARDRGKAAIDLTATIGLSELGLFTLRNEAASASVEAERLEVVAFIVGLAFDVRRALVDVQAAEQTLELFRTVLAATQASADAAGHLHEAGNLTDLDLATERAFNEEAHVASRRAEIARTEARARLSELLGLSARTAWSVPPRLADPPAEELAASGLEQRAVEQSLELAIVKQRARAAEKQATLARVEGWVPDLRAGVSAERDDRWGVGPTAAVELPLFYQGQGRVDAARAEMRRQADLHAQLMLEIESRARSAASRLAATRASALECRDVLMPLRQRVLDQTELQYNAMNASVFQLLQAKREEIETAREYVELLRDYWHARSEVDGLKAGKSLGLGDGARP